MSNVLCIPYFSDIRNFDHMSIWFEKIFFFIHQFSIACAIDDEDSVVLTGGISSMSLMTRYNVEGEATTLPSLNTGRYGHACGRVTTSTSDKVRKVSLGSWKIMNTPRLVLYCHGRAHPQLKGPRARPGFHGDFEEEWWDLLVDSSQPANCKRCY